MIEGRYAFRALIYPSDDKYEAKIPAFSVTTFGVDMPDAIYMAQDLMETIVSYYVEEGIEVPQEDLTDDMKHEIPEGGCIAVLFSDRLVAEVKDMSVQDAADSLGTSTNSIYTL